MKKICILLAILTVILCGCTPREKKEAYLAQTQPTAEAQTVQSYASGEEIIYKRMEGEPAIYAYRQHGLWGIADQDKQPITAPRFNEIKGFFGDYAVCSMTDYTVEPVDDLSGAGRYLDVWGVINREGETVVPFKYSWMARQQDGRYRVVENDLTGVMTIEGDMIVEPQYWDIDDFQNGYAIVAREDFTHDVAKQDIAKLYYGLINEDGDEVLPLEYDKIQWDKGTLSAVKKGEIEQYSVMGGELVKKGDVTFFVSSDEYDGFGSKICDDPEIHKYDMLDLTGLSDGEGNPITGPEFAEINAFKGGYAPAAKWDYTANPVDASGKLEFPKYFGVIDTKGNTVVDFKYSRISLSEDGRTAYMDEDIAIATINDDGSVILLEAAEEAARQAEERWQRTMRDILAEEPQETHKAEVGSDSIEYRLEKGDPNVYAFSQGGLWGLADADKNTLIEPKFEVLDSFQGNFAVAGCVDDTLPPRDFSGSKEYSRVYGVINRQGETVVDFVYDSMLRQRDDLYIMGKDGLKGLISADGTIILAPTFSNIHDFTGNYAVAQNEKMLTFENGSTSVAARQGLINDRGEILLPCEYDRVKVVEGKNNSMVFVASRGKDISQYVAVDHGIVKLEKDSELTPADFAGKKLCENPEIYSYCINGLYGLVSADGKVITGPEYANICEFENGYAIAQKFDFDGEAGYYSGEVEYPTHWGILDTEGRVVEEFTHKLQIEFAGEGNIIRYFETNQWGGEVCGYKEAGGKTITEAKYMVAGDFVGGYAVVAEFVQDFSTANDDSSSGPNGTYYFGVIDTKGETVVPLEYQEQVYADDGAIVLRRSGHEYHFDPQTKEMVKMSGSVPLQ